MPERYSSRKLAARQSAAGRWPPSRVPSIAHVESDGSSRSAVGSVPESALLFERRTPTRLGVLQVEGSAPVILLSLRMSCSRSGRCHAGGSAPVRPEAGATSDASEVRSVAKLARSS